MAAGLVRRSVQWLSESVPEKPRPWPARDLSFVRSLCEVSAWLSRMIQPTTDQRRCRLASAHGAPLQAAGISAVRQLQTPLTYALAQMVGLDPQSLAYRYKRERPFSPAVQNPSLGLGKSLSMDRIGTFGVGLDATQRVFQDRQYQTLQRMRFGILSANTVVILRRCQHIWNHQPSERTFL